MKQYTVSSFDEFHEVIKQFDQPKFIFRGQADSKWGLLPKIGRLEYHKHLSKALSEKFILGAWKRYSIPFLQKEPIDEWDLLVLAQHYGLATRLLDWTKNPLVALYFAVIDNSAYNTNSAVYVLDYDNQVIQTNKITPFELTSSAVFFPKGLSARILSQRSMFTISHEPNIDLSKLAHPYFSFYKIIIKKKATESIIRGLDFYGVNELTIFQDLDNLSKHLNRYIQQHGSRNIKELLQ